MTREPDRTVVYMGPAGATNKIKQQAAEIKRLTALNKRLLLRDAEWAIELGRLRAEVERLTEAHERIVEWSRAYPLSIFPEPDLKKARELLEAGGMTLDAISAHAMRHVIEQVAEISRAALEPKP